VAAPLFFVDNLMHWSVEYLIELVDHSPYSQAEIERKAGVKANSIARWKNENRIPRFEQLDKVLNVLGHRLAIAKLGTKVC
jgi:transcriptional regulator with XRE-family HTH domain